MCKRRLLNTQREQGRISKLLLGIFIFFLFALFLPNSGPLLSFTNIFKEQQCDFTEINVTFRLPWKKS